MNHSIELNEVALSIYDAAMEPGRWPAVLLRVADFIGARGAFLFELEGCDAERHIHASHFSENYDPALVRAYLRTHNDQELADQDAFARASKRTDAIELIDDDVLAPSRSELEARPNAVQMRSYGIAYRAGALLNKDQIHRDRFAVQFSARDGGLDPARQARAMLVMPHIAKALNISRPITQLQMRNEAAADVLDKLVVGICILDKTGAIVMSNAEFERQIATYRVFRRDAHGKLRMTDHNAALAFSRLTDGAANHGHFGGRPRKEAIVAEVDGEAHALCVEISPLRSVPMLDEPRLMGHVVYSMDTGQAYPIDTSTLSHLFDLSATEAVILEMLSDGLTNTQISERRDRSVETVNSQVKSLLQKTHSANRTQLIRLATNIGGSFVRDCRNE